MDRRNFLKLMGAGALAGGAVAAGVVGHSNGADPMTRLGWEAATRTPDTLFDRTPFEVDEIPNRIVGTVVQPTIFDNSHWRRRALRLAIGIGIGGDSGDNLELREYLQSTFPTDGAIETANAAEFIPRGVQIREPAATSPEAAHDLTSDDLIAHYQSRLASEGRNMLAADIRNFTHVNPFRTEQEPNWSTVQHIHRAVQASFGAEVFNGTFDGRALGEDGTPATVAGRVITGPADTRLHPDGFSSDWVGVNPNGLSVSDPYRMTEIVKRLAMILGSSNCRIVDLRPETHAGRTNRGFAYSHSGAQRGYAFGQRIELADHWRFGIMLSQTHLWEMADAQPSFGGSFDAYGQVGVTAARLTAFIKSLGYPAREGGPFVGHAEFLLTPLCVASGWGELGRTSTCIAPDVGGALRPAMIVTNLPMIPDRPINAGIARFCEACEICADACPSGSIERGGQREMSTRGYQGWTINMATCHNFVRSSPGNYCITCVHVCPFTQKSNWLHTFARDVVTRDPTNISSHALVWMDRAFYGSHDGPAVYEAIMRGGFPTIKNEKPWWLDTSNAFHV